MLARAGVPDNSARALDTDIGIAPDTCDMDPDAPWCQPVEVLGTSVIVDCDVDVNSPYCPVTVLGVSHEPARN